MEERQRKKKMQNKCIEYIDNYSSWPIFIRISRLATTPVWFLQQIYLQYFFLYVPSVIPADEQRTVE